MRNREKVLKLRHFLVATVDGKGKPVFDAKILTMNRDRLDAALSGEPVADRDIQEYIGLRKIQSGATEDTLIETSEEATTETAE